MKTKSSLVGLALLSLTACTEDLETGTAEQEVGAVETYPFPLRAEDLPPGAYYYVSNDHSDDSGARDIVARRWDGSEWIGVTPSFADYAADPDNEDHLIYNRPVRSPVSGWVVSCWRNSPNGLQPAVYGEDDVPHPGRVITPEHPTRTILQSGNHVNIITDDGEHVMLLAHMAPGSVPSSICPNEATFVANADNAQGEFPVESIVPLEQRVHVRQGDIVGAVGSVGASSGPHLHVHLKNITGWYSNDVPKVSASIEIPWHGVYDRTNPPDDGANTAWNPVEEGTLDVGEQILARPFIRQSDDAPSANTIAEQVSLSLVGRVVIATRDVATGNLRLDTYTTDAGELVHEDQEIVGAASQIALSTAGTSNDFVVALRDGLGNLKLIGYRVTNTGALIRRGDASAGAVSKIAIAEAPSGLGVVTAVRDSAGTLKLISWAVDDANATITRVATYPGGAIDEAALTTLDASSFKGVALASKVAGNLRVETFSVTPALAITKLGTANAGGASNLVAETVQIDAFTQRIVVGMRDAGNALRFIDYSVTGSGSLIREGDVADGAVSGLAMERGAQGGDFVAATTDGSGNLRVSAYKLDPDAAPMERSGDVLAGAATKTTVASIIDDTYGRMMIVSMADSAGKQKVIAYRFTN
ncbi:MAG: hypothetical protein HOW73_15330 [Polyangiaceae bacterium]|nr:hypothetical protein [Polyangiaceae bacterium]